MTIKRPKDIPPQSLEAEQSVIGAILLDNEALLKSIEIVKPEDFYFGSHRQIYQCIIELFNKNQPTDIVTVTEILRNKNLIEEIGGASFLAEISDKTFTSANIEYYAKIVKEKSLNRKLIASATEIISRVYKAEEEIEDIIDFSEKTIFDISQFHIKPSFYPIKDIITSTLKNIETLYQKKQLITGVASGFKDLDSLTSGFQPSDLIIVAGRPSMGKTAFCLNIGMNAAHEHEIPVAIFSLEMSKEQLALRILCSEARVDNHKVRSGFLPDSDWSKLAIAAGKIAEANIFIDDTPGITVLEMRAKARRLKAEKGLGMIVVDYLQLMNSSRSRSESREQEISEISRSLKALAKELNIPVIALSQLNRKVEDRSDKRPQMADLRESGAIEQDADVIIFIYRDEVYHPDSEESKGKAEIIIGKQRNGPTGEVELAFINDYTRFEDLSTRHP